MKKILAIATVACAATALTGVQTAAAAKPPIRGDMRCSVVSGLVHFDPPALDFTDRGLPPSARRGSSHVSFITQVTGCRGTSASSPAPAGIDHGVLELKGNLKHHDCSNLDEMRLKVRLQLFDASGTLVAKRNVATTTSIVVDFDPPSADPPWTFTFAGLVRPPGTRVFGGELVAMTGVANGGTLSHFCQSNGLDSFFLNGDALTVGNPM